MYHKKCSEKQNAGFYLLLFFRINTSASSSFKVTQSRGSLPSAVVQFDNYIVGPGPYFRILITICE